ncbi:hypothetical protein MKEN_00527300 [Mycena kentingensis (nom. inval.)]|nr:hypothetical protein MKEN_00527300 [Mycena kentingensis (nom. inval.)]
MLWIPTAKTTRSGRIFASFLQATTFSIHGPLALTVSAKSDEQQDYETDDNLDDLDELPPEPNLLDDLDKPLPDPRPQPWKRKRSLPPDFTLPPPPKDPQSGAHRRRQRKREEKTAATKLGPRRTPTANSAWVATGESAGKVRGGKKPRTVMDFLKIGFTNVCWDGKTTRPLVDKHGRVFAVLAGQPDGQHYTNAVRRINFKKHRLGRYAAVTVGFSYGQGQTVPGWLQRPHCEVGEALLENPDVQKVASFASTVFAPWAPRLYQYYRKYNADLSGRRPFRTLLGLPGEGAGLPHDKYPLPEGILETPARQGTVGGGEHPAAAAQLEIGSLWNPHSGHEGGRGWGNSVVLPPSRATPLTWGLVLAGARRGATFEGLAGRRVMSGFVEGGRRS